MANLVLIGIIASITVIYLVFYLSITTMAIMDNNPSGVIKTLENECKGYSRGHIFISDTTGDFYISDDPQQCDYVVPKTYVIRFLHYHIKKFTIFSITVVAIEIITYYYDLDGITVLRSMIYGLYLTLSYSGWLSRINI